LRLERFEERVVPSFNPTNYPAGTGPFGIVAADFQGIPGNVDMAVVNINSSNVSVYLNNHDGTGTFTGPTNYPAGPRGINIAAADLNGDGLNDIVVANYGTSTTPADTVTILFNDPTNPGHFLAPVSLHVGDTFPTGLALVDVNGDGLPDIVTANESVTPTGTVSVLLNDPTNPGNFLAPQTYAAGPADAMGNNSPYGLAVADFYGDGLPSVAVADAITGDVTVLRDDPTNPGALQPFTVVASITTSGGAAASPRSLAAADLGTGSPSLVTANFNDPSISVLVNTGGGAFAAPARYAAGTNPIRVTTGDVDGDGFNDVVVANFGAGGASQGGVSLLLNDGTGTGGLQPAQTILAGSATSNRPSGVAVADVQPDGLNDVLVSNFASNNVTVLIQSIPSPPGNSGSDSASEVGSFVVQGQEDSAAVGAEGRNDSFSDLTAAELGFHGKSDQAADGSPAQPDTSHHQVAAQDSLFGDLILGGLLRADVV
jgi:hypothetical protein